MEPRNRFADNLRSVRKARNWSQEELGHRSGLHPTEVSRLERAVRDPRLGTIVRLARALEVPAARLLKGID
jgi:transcriptional regulator with XRE-family HTH domain